MTVDDAVAQPGVDRSDAEVLLAALLEKDRAWILAHGDTTLGEAQLRTWKEWHARRAAHEPVAYITNTKDFCGRPFFVDERVLIPRPSTEGLVEAIEHFLQGSGDFVQEIDSGIVAFVKSKSKIKPKIIVDVGTGSGCVAITLELRHPERRIIATDVSAPALDVAKINAERHGVLSRLELRQGDFLEPVSNLSEPFLVVSNPPYIPKGVPLMPDVSAYEPVTALFADDEGMSVLRRLVQQSREYEWCVGFALECRAEQAEALQKC